MRKMMFALAAASMTASPMVIAVAPAHAQDGYYHGKTWRGKDGRTYCRKKNGTTGLLIGAAGGALVGRAVDSHGSRATGTILGAAAGALLGREVEKSRGFKCR